jgi:hypothetical protein
MDDLYARLFNRFAQPDPNSPYQMQSQDKHRAVQRGLLQMAAALAKPNGGNLTASIANGLLAGSNSVNDAQSQYGNDAYRADIMKRTQAGMEANTRTEQLRQSVMGPDGKLDEAKFQQYAMQDPSGAKALRDVLQPQERWSPTNVTFNGASGTVMSDGMGHLRTLDGKPFQAPQEAAQGDPAPTSGAGPNIMGDALTQAVQSVESGGNPNAVSPKGAVGLMQTMPNTLRDPGFGVAPARDNSPAEQARVGRDYLAAMTKQYGTQGGLAAYNMGPGAWQASLSKYGTPDAALAHAPAETQAYVPKVLARAGGSAPSVAQAPALPFGFAKKEAAAASEPKLGQDYRWADAAHTKAEPIPGSAADQGSSGLDADSIKNLAYDQIFTGHRPPAGRNGGSAVFKAVENEVARAAKEAGVSPMALATQAGRTKVVLKTMEKLQQRTSFIDAQAQTVAKNADYAAGLQAAIHPSQYPVINKYILAGKSNYMGDPKVAGFITAVNSVQTEYAKVMSGSTGSAAATDSAMAHARSLFNANMNPAQIVEVTKAMKAEIANQQSSYNAELTGLSARMQEFGGQNAAPSGATVWTRDPRTGKLVRGR